MLKDKTVLFHFFLSQFGFDSFDNLKRTCSEIEFSQNHVISPFLGVLVSRDTQVSRYDLAKYDENIMEYLKQINQKKELKIKLKYYQYFTALFSEYFLDHYFRDPEQLCNNLNLYLEQFNQNNHEELPHFKMDDLSKLAIWHATGAGKTFMLHINILQYRYYCKNINNVILLTPSEDMSRQHYEDLLTSGIEADYYINNRGGSGVKVIDIHKIKEFKKGQGVTVPVSEFGQQNLILVDEGHKGSATEDSIWRDLRDQMSVRGFTFEYSATFGQITNNELKNSYAKRIVFNYSYRRFYDDGYGKHFWIHNLGENKAIDTKDEKRQYFLTNLCLFLQQKILYNRNRELMNEYQIEQPLMLFVGHTVTSGNKVGKAEQVDNQSTISDVLQIVEFIQDFSSRPVVYKEWLNNIILSQDDIFSDDYRGKFDYLINQCNDGTVLYDLLLQEVFYAFTPGELEIVEIKSANSEIGMKLSTSENYFALIYIGNTSTFRNSLPEGISKETDSFTQPLFPIISAPQPKPVNILIGARMFIEGWNSYRVSMIGLINFGRSEGSQIIQLFGRGVRLRGKNNSLKRSEGNGRPEYLEIVETLNIFGLNADYMNRFMQEMKKEGLDRRTKVVKLPVKLKYKNIDDEGLYTLISKNDKLGFRYNNVFSLEADKDIPVINIDLSLRRLAFTVSRMENFAEASPNPFTIPEYYGEGMYNILNWSSIYRRVLQHKHRQSYYNLQIKRESLRSLIETIRYRILLDTWPSTSNLRELVKIEEIIVKVLNSYIDTFYQSRWREHESKNMSLAKLDNNNENLNFNSYELELAITDGEGQSRYNITQVVNKIKETLEDKDNYPQSFKEPSSKVKITWFDEHLYQPLVLEVEEQCKTILDSGQVIQSITPKGLNIGEATFVSDLQSTIRTYRDTKYKDIFFYLLRNKSRKGLGFYFDSAGGFYPDFMLWIKVGEKQHLAFIDPHGLRFEQNEFDSPRIRLYEDIKEISLENPNVELHSFILVPPNGERLVDLGWRLPEGVTDIEKFANGVNVFQMPPKRENSERPVTPKYIEQIFNKILAK
jgi:hypothetical protein